jgi:hypothetical protein
MKRLSVVLLLFMVGCSTMQLPPMSEVDPPTETAFEGANVIYIQTTDNREEARRNVARMVQTEGYDIVAAESGPNLIATGVTTFSSDVPGSARYRFQIPDGDDVRIEVTGQIIQSRVSDWQRFQQFDANRLEAGGGRRSLMWNAWRQMETLAELYGGDATYMYDRQD